MGWLKFVPYFYYRYGLSNRVEPYRCIIIAVHYNQYHSHDTDTAASCAAGVARYSEGLRKEKDILIRIVIGY